MKINAEFDQRVVVHSGVMDWQDSPMPGVSRRPLDRVGGEVARATSVVRYAPGSSFSSHVHTGGEEFLVIDGVFQDEHGDFPAGSYIRNPPQSSHTPGSEPGCTILVKLWQFEPEDRKSLRLQTDELVATPHPTQAGVSTISLYQDELEQVSLQTWESGCQLELNAEAGIEVFVLEGSFTQQADELVTHSWLRLPAGDQFFARAGQQGAKVWVKQNHLKTVTQQIQRVVAVR